MSGFSVTIHTRKEDYAVNAARRALFYAAQDLHEDTIEVTWKENGEERVRNRIKVKFLGNKYAKARFRIVTLQAGVDTDREERDTHDEMVAAVDHAAFLPLTDVQPAEIAVTQLREGGIEDPYLRVMLSVPTRE